MNVRTISFYDCKQEKSLFQNDVAVSYVVALKSVLASEPAIPKE